MENVFWARCKKYSSYLFSRKVGEFTKYRVLIGAMLMIFPNALPWYIGNVLPYTYSYFRCNLQSRDVYDEILWVLPVFIIVSVTGVTTLDLVRKLLPLRVVLLLSLATYEIGLFLTYFTVKQSAWGMEMALPILTGYGHGTQMALAFVIIGHWFKDSVGTATSAVASTSGFGAIACTAITTAFMNPDNLKPDVNDGTFYYFSYKDINDRFPKLFLILGIFSSVFHIVAFCLLEVATVSMDQSRNEGTGEMTVVISRTENNSFTEYSPLDIRDDVRKYTTQNLARQNRCEDQNNHPRLSAAHDHEASCIENNGTLNTSEIEKEINPLNNESSDDSKFASDKGPLQMLKTEVFYYIWICSLSMTIGFVTVNSNYKLFGQKWIQDDSFYAAVGTVANIATVVCRLGVGLMMDRLGVFNAIAIMMTTNTVGMALWYFTPRLDRWLFLLWTSFLVGLQSSTYITFPVAALVCFGSKHYTTNTGLILASMVAGSLMTPPVTSLLVTTVGWFWLFVLGSALCLASVLLLVVRMSAVKAAL